VATGAAQVWSCDIAKLHGPTPGVYYDLYVVLDIYSRYVPGFRVAPTETGDLAKEFIAATIAAAGTAPRVIHADRGTSMTSKPVALLLADLGVVRSQRRPKKDAPPDQVAACEAARKAQSSQRNPTEHAIALIRW
jgi:putative transposase